MEHTPSNVDVINVAGLLMNGENDGIESALRAQLSPRFIRTIAPTPLRAAREDPRHAVERAAAQISQCAAEIEDQFGTPRMLVVGRSYGAFMALLAAIRTEFKNIFKVILIEGPLHPHITVRPPPLLPPLMLCGVHYEERPGLAEEATRSLAQLGMGERVITIQGGCEDDVVPLAAQVLHHNNNNGAACRVVTLPEHAAGIATGLKNMLPQGYRNHLFWSKSKMKLVTDVVLREAAGAHESPDYKQSA